MWVVVVDVVFFVVMVLAVVLIVRRALRHLESRADQLEEVGYWRGWRSGWEGAVQWSRRNGIPDGVNLAAVEEPADLPECLRRET